MGTCTCITTGRFPVIIQAFTLIDQDNDGLISEEDLSKIYQMTGKVCKRNMKHTTIQYDLKSCACTNTNSMCTLNSKNVLIRTLFSNTILLWLL